VHLYARHLRPLGVSVPYESGDGAYQRYTGDTSVPGQGEILVWHPRAAGPALLDEARRRPPVAAEDELG
jgi:hypothetical protein